MPNEKKADVSTPGLCYNAMEDVWDLIHDLMGGTKAMRAAGEKWLPLEQAEEFADYARRLDRSTLYNAFKKTVNQISARPFVKPVTLEGQRSELVDAIAGNCDQTGSDLTQFARQCFKSMVMYGMTHILVDYPQATEVKTLADERQAGMRPYFVQVKPPDLLGFTTEVGLDGAPVLTQVRIKEKIVERDGEFGESVRDSIRVLRPGQWEVWVQDETKEGKVWVMREFGTSSLQKIPLITVYASAEGFMLASAPLEDLAWTNVDHWQSASDQKNILRIARVGLLFGSGFTNEEIDAGITVSVSKGVFSTNSEAKLSYIEHSGKAIGAGAEDLHHLEQRMEVQGMQPLIQRTGTVTATGKAIDESRNQSDVQAWIGALESGLYDAFDLAEQWVGGELAADFKVNIYSDFSMAWNGGQDVQTLSTMQEKGQISHRTLLNETKRRGLLSDAIDVDEEIARIQTEKVDEMPEMSLPPDLQDRLRPGTPAQQGQEGWSNAQGSTQDEE